VILLGHLRMNVEQAIDALLTVASVVFPDDIESKIDPDVNSKNLKQTLEDILQNRGVSLDTLMRDQGRPSTRCKCMPHLMEDSLHSCTYQRPLRRSIF